MNVTDWQHRAQPRTGEILGQCGERADWNTVEVREDPALDHQVGDVYLTTTVIRAKARYRIYIYKDEAGVDVDGEWHPFELPDWDNDPGTLLQGLGSFLRQRLETACDDAR